MEAEVGAYRYAGGGGGSGFVWTEDTASNVPTGYSVDTKYYLADAGTYGSGETGFVESPNTDGHADGYARITATSLEYDVEKTATRWITIEQQIERGILTGIFDYNGYTITVIDTEDNEIEYPLKPTVTASVSDITQTGATITATGTDVDGDTLQYTLLIDGEIVSGPSTTNTWVLTDLNPNTEYTYVVEVTDGTYTVQTTGQTFTTLPLNEPTVTAKATNITATSATITATGYDADGDTLQYKLTINGETYGPSTTNSWTISNLSAGTTYTYVVEVTDGTFTVSTGTLSFTTNRTPTVTATVSSITSTGATITATGTDADGDTLQYTLVVNGETYGPSTTRSWNITGLSEQTTYAYTVTVTDGYNSSDTTGAFKTYCAGGTRTTKTCSSPVLCTINRTSTTSDCSSCTDGIVGCAGGSSSVSKTLSYDYVTGDCPICGEGLWHAQAWYTVTVSCSGCDETWSVRVCYTPSCYNDTSAIIAQTGFSSHGGTTCGDCNGVGTITTYSYSGTCSTHSTSGKHYYCSTHDQVCTSSTHTYVVSTYCEHGYDTEHSVD